MMTDPESKAGGRVARSQQHAAVGQGLPFLGFGSKSLGEEYCPELPVQVCEAAGKSHLTAFCGGPACGGTESSREKKSHSETRNSLGDWRQTRSGIGPGSNTACLYLPYEPGSRGIFAPIPRWGWAPAGIPPGGRFYRPTKSGPPLAGNNQPLFSLGTMRGGQLAGVWGRIQTGDHWGPLTFTARQAVRKNAESKL